jgi:hypothetical protein
MDFVWFSLWTAIISLNHTKQLVFMMVKCGVLFEVQTELFKTNLMSFLFKGLIVMKMSQKLKNVDTCAQTNSKNIVYCSNEVVLGKI